MSEQSASSQSSFLPAVAGGSTVAVSDVPTAAERVGPGASRQSIEAAATEWRERLGPGQVLVDEGEVGRYSRTTLPSAPRPAAVVRARSREDVVTTVEVAARHRVPLYPISRGKNWGWGDGCPVGDGQVVLDLAGMNRIIEVDDEVGYAVVEPGVTQGQLVDYLAERDLPWLMDCAASGPTASILGNFIERGLGNSPQGERFSAIAGMEVVLADATVVPIGFGHFPNSRVSHALRWGVGPSLDGLFSQSNLGIVTQLGIWLVPKPEYSEMVFFTAEDAVFETLVDRVRFLRLHRLLPGTVHVLPSRARSGGSQWTGFGGIYGSRSVVAAQREELISTIGDLARVEFVRREALDTPGAIAGHLESLDLPPGVDSEELVTAGFSFFNGLSYEFSPLFMLNWVGGAATQHPLANPTSPDPLENDYGLYFLMPTCRCTGQEARALYDLMRPIFERYGFPVLCHCNFINGRGIIMVSWIPFDRKDDERRRAARACHRELLSTTIAAGHPPYRMGIETMDLLDPGKSSFWKLVRTLKHALDPAGILAPGRYEPPG